MGSRGEVRNYWGKAKRRYMQYEVWRGTLDLDPLELDSVDCVEIPPEMKQPSHFLRNFYKLFKSA
jgi:hypothetical protein